MNLIVEGFKSSGIFFNLVLGSMSLATVAMIIWQMIRLQRYAGRRAINQELHTAAASGDVAQIEQLAASDSGALATLYRESLRERGRGLGAVRRTIDGLIDFEFMPRLQAPMPYMTTLAKAGPMVGLAGTVWGMMSAFEKIGSSDSQGINSQVLASDISLALFTTLWGLAIAILIIACQSVFKPQIKQQEDSLIKSRQQILDVLAATQ